MTYVCIYIHTYIHACMHTYIHKYIVYLPYSNILYFPPARPFVAVRLQGVSFTVSDLPTGE